MKSTKYIGRSIMIGFLIGIVLSMILVIIKAVSGESIGLNNTFWRHVGYTMTYAVVLTLLNRLFFDYINKKIVWKNFAQYRIIIGAVGSIVLTMLGVFFIRASLKLYVEGEDWGSFIAGESAVYYVVALLITIVISVFFHAVYFYKAWQERKVKEHKIIAGTASAKFDALKNQLDPHFLFNSLNVLTSLIDEDPEQAQKFTTSLSKVYRYVLEQKNKDLVTVDEELKFAKTYVRLLKMRFEDSIIFDIPEHCSDPEAKIVPLSLQLLLENAVKHNVATPKKPLHIKVNEQSGYIEIRNNLQEREVVKKSSGVGLRNILQRYNILSDREVKINKTSAEFSVLLPMLTKKVSIMETQEMYIKDKRYQKAKERVEAVKGFYGNLTAYCIVIPFLIWLNMRTTSFPWAIFPALGWGFGVTMHGLEAYGYNPLWGKRWEERKIKELMEKDDF